MAEYIEREAARKYILDEYPLLQRDRLMRTIDDIPAADARPVRRGKWEAVRLDHERMGCRPTAHYCSECHQITWFRTFFCPNCGADMRETEDEKA